MTTRRIEHKHKIKERDRDKWRERHSPLECIQGCSMYTDTPELRIPSRCQKRKKKPNQTKSESTQQLRATTYSIEGRNKELTQQRDGKMRGQNSAWLYLLGPRKRLFTQRTSTPALETVFVWRAGTPSSFMHVMIVRGRK